MNTLKQFADLIKDFKTMYEAGGIQNRSRPDSWRQDWASFLDKNGREAINPFADNGNIFNPSVMGFKDSGESYTLDELIKTDEGKHAILLKQTELNDLYYISKKTDVCLFYLDDSAGFGTYTEFRETYDNYKIPIIIIRNISRLSLPHWITWRRYKALTIDNRAIEFKSLSEAKQFFIDYLGFKE